MAPQTCVNMNSCSSVYWMLIVTRDIGVHKILAFPLRQDRDLFIHNAHTAHGMSKATFHIMRNGCLL